MIVQYFDDEYDDDGDYDDDFDIRNAFLKFIWD